MAERKSILLRISPKLWADLQRLAESEFRSLNGQIEYLLQEAVKKRIGKSVSKGDKLSP
ncbi:MAG: Arc family DNA binding domain-containing protein [Fimbriimonadales bacterium]